MTAFSNPEAVAERFHNNPGHAVSLLGTMLTETQAESFESQLIPVPDSDERMRVLLEAHRMLKRAGLPEDDTVLAAIRRETEPAD